MAIFGSRKKKEEDLFKSSEKTPDFVKVSYDEKHKPIDVQPAEGHEIDEFCVFSKKDKNLIFQWLDYLNRYHELIRQEIHQMESDVPKSLIDKLNKIESEISLLHENLPKIQAKIESLQFLDTATRADLENTKQELLKTINDSVVSKEELVDSITARLQTKPKKTKRIPAAERERMMTTITKVVNFALKLNPEERVLVVTDRKMRGLGRMFYRIARERNQGAIMMVIPVASRAGEEPDDVVAEAMKGSDLIIITTYKSMTHTNAVRNALEAGARIASIPNLPKVSLLEGGMTADFDLTKKNASAMFDAVNYSNEIELTSTNGTELKFSVTNRKWIESNGYIDQKGKVGNLPGGEVFVAPVEESVHGKIVFDYFVLAKDKLELTVKNGIVVKMKGRTKKLRKIFKDLGDGARTVGEFGIGCNASAKIVGNTVEDEKVFGTVHLALGNNLSFGGKNDVEFHEDGIIENPTLKIDGKIVIENGKWVI